MSATDPVREEDVKGFWEREACGERYGEDQDRIRYELEPEILRFAGYEPAAGKRVLEIGVGMGADFLRWVRAGAVATGFSAGCVLAWARDIAGRYLARHNGGDGPWPRTGSVG